MKRFLKAIGNYVLRLILDVVTAVLVTVTAAIFVALIIAAYWEQILTYFTALTGG